MSKREKLLLAAIVAIAALWLLELLQPSSTIPGSSRPTERASGTVTAAHPSPDLELVSWQFIDRHITGVVRNNTARTYSYVQIEFTLHDESGRQVGSTFTNVNNLGPYSEWRFRAFVFEGDATRARFVRVTGW
jgi:hypothetical protein